MEKRLRRDNLFELSYIANSPKSIVQSFKELPFVQHHIKEQRLEIDGPFTVGTLYYHKLEDGLYMMYTHMEFRADVSFRLMYDKSIPASNYYVLGYHVNANDFASHTTTINDVLFAKKCCTFFKPEGRKVDRYSEGTVSQQLTIHFDETWLNKNLRNDKRFDESNLRDFFDCNSLHLYWGDTTTDIDRNFTSIVNTFMQKKSDGLSHLLQLKILSFEFISCCIENWDSRQTAASRGVQANNCRTKMLKIEAYLCARLSAKFEGIEAISIRFAISPSKLKNDFKSVFGKSVFQYFREQQMFLARELLRNEDVRIKEISSTFGYENPGKFSSAYKKYFSILPSEQLQGQ